MSGQDLQTFAGLDVPDAHGLVEGAGDNHVGLGVEVDAEDVVGVAMEGLDERPRCHVPQPQRLVVGGRHQKPRVGREGEVRDALLVSMEFVDRREEGAGIGPIEGVGTEGLVGGGGAEKATVR